MNKRTAVTAKIANVFQHGRTGKWRFILSFPFSEGEGTITIKSLYSYRSDTEAFNAPMEQAKAHDVKVW